jgi:hypothetical protein
MVWIPVAHAEPRFRPAGAAPASPDRPIGHPTLSRHGRGNNFLSIKLNRVFLFCWQNSSRQSVSQSPIPGRTK